MTETNNDFLVEIGTEELPPLLLPQLASNLCQNLQLQLTKAQLTYNQAIYFATPRRLAVLLTDTASQQQQQIFEKFGPQVGLAYDKQGNPTAAALRFAKSCQVAVTDLTTKIATK